MPCANEPILWQVLLTNVPMFTGNHKHLVSNSLCFFCTNRSVTVKCRHAYLLLSYLSNRRCLGDLRGVCWHCTATILLQQVDCAVEHVAYVIGQGCIHYVPEPPLRKVPVLQYKLVIWQVCGCGTQDGVATTLLSPTSMTMSTVMAIGQLHAGEVNLP